MDVRNPRRAQPGARRQLREAITGGDMSPQEKLEQASNLTRKDTPEYREFLAKGAKARSGRVTATETGAKKMAQELDVERITRSRKIVNDMKREKARVEKGRIT